MAEVCPKCGLPLDICSCKALEREAEKIKISVEKRRFGKLTTVVEGIRENAKGLASQLKSKLACGGTFKKGHIELQGNHRDKVKDILIGLGYSEEQIELR